MEKVLICRAFVPFATRFWNYRSNELCATEDLNPEPTVDKTGALTVELVARRVTERIRTAVARFTTSNPNRWMTATMLYYKRSTPDGRQTPRQLSRTDSSDAAHTRHF